MTEYKEPIDTLALYPIYEDWFLKETWSLLEAAAITLGINPSYFIEANDELFNNELRHYHEEDELQYDIVLYSMFFGDLYENLQDRIDWFKGHYMASEFILPIKNSKGNVGYKPNHIIQWCVDNAISLHFTLVDFLKDKGFNFRLSDNCLIFNEYKEFAKKEIWNLSSAACLIIGISPHANKTYLNRFQSYYKVSDFGCSKTKYDEVFFILRLAEESYKQGNLNFIERPDEGFANSFDPEKCAIIVESKEIIQWAINKGFSPPPQLLELMSLKEKEFIQPQMNSSYISPYMNLMLEVIKELSINKENMPLKKQIIACLENKKINGNRLGKREVEYLATFIRTPEAKIGGNRKST